MEIKVTPTSKLREAQTTTSNRPKKRKRAAQALGAGNECDSDSETGVPDASDVAYRGQLSQLDARLKALRNGRKTRNGLLVSAEQYHTATTKGGTLRRFDGTALMVNTCLAPGQKPPKSGRSHISIQTQVTADGTLGFTTMVFGRITARSDSPSLLHFGLLGFTATSAAVYRSKEHSLRATLLHCCIDHSYITGRYNKGIPNWLEKHIGAATLDTDPLKGYVVCQFNCAHLAGNDHLLGLLARRVGSIHFELHVPEDSSSSSLMFEDIDKWRAMVLKPPPWVDYPRSSVSNKASLIGHTMQKMFGDKTYQGRVSSYDRLEDHPTPMYCMTYVDGDSEHIGLEQLLCLLK